MEISYIAADHDWNRWARYCGAPPVVFAEGPFQFRRPWHQRLHPPFAMNKYAYERRGWVNEHVEFRPGCYILPVCGPGCGDRGKADHDP